MTSIRIGSGLATAAVWTYTGFAGMSVFVGGVVALLEGHTTPATAVPLAVIGVLIGVVSWQRSLAVMQGVGTASNAAERRTAVVTA